MVFLKDEYLDVSIQYKAWDEWTHCFRVPDLKLPMSPFLGFSAITGDVHDAHECVFPALAVCAALTAEQHHRGDDVVRDPLVRGAPAQSTQGREGQVRLGVVDEDVPVRSRVRTRVLWLEAIYSSEQAAPRVRRRGRVRRPRRRQRGFLLELEELLRVYTFAMLCLLLAMLVVIEVSYVMGRVSC
jgi:hypothetical protein